jgi:hypothetical protein
MKFETEFKRTVHTITLTLDAEGNKIYFKQIYYRKPCKVGCEKCIELKQETSTARFLLHKLWFNL